MVLHKKIKIDNKYIEAILIRLARKNLIVLKGHRGYVMCGYLNLQAAQKFKDAAVKITGVSTLGQAMKAHVSGCTHAARKLGIYKGQPIREVLKIIA